MKQLNIDLSFVFTCKISYLNLLKAIESFILRKKCIICRMYFNILNSVLDIIIYVKMSGENDMNIRFRGNCTLHWYITAHFNLLSSRTFSNFIPQSNLSAIVSRVLRTSDTRDTRNALYVTEFNSKFNFNLNVNLINGFISLGNNGRIVRRFQQQDACVDL